MVLNHAGSRTCRFNYSRLSRLLVLVSALGLGCLAGCGGSVTNPAARQLPTSQSLSSDVRIIQASELPANLPRIQPKAKFMLPAHGTNEWNRVQLSANGQRLAIGYRTPTFTNATQVWELSSQPKKIADIPGSPTFALSPSGQLIAISENPESKVYEVPSKKVIAKFPGWFH